MRRYLVARDADRDPRLRHFRVDRIRVARLLGSSFTRDPGFDIVAHAARAFGSFQDEARYGEVVWRFTPEAAPTAREFVFHPDQRLEEMPYGALVVRFIASGWLEMAWHLYQWGDQVEVLAPAGLRAMVEGHRRGDFEALP
jgi:predicted DNA-binding transcriptional regulator YafY